MSFCCRFNSNPNSNPVLNHNLLVQFSKGLLLLFFSMLCIENRTHTRFADFPRSFGFFSSFTVFFCCCCRDYKLPTLFAYILLIANWESIKIGTQCTFGQNLLFPNGQLQLWKLLPSGNDDLWTITSHQIDCFFSLSCLKSQNHLSIRICRPCEPWMAWEWCDVESDWIAIVIAFSM